MHSKGKMAMASEEYHGTDKSKTIDTVKVEWNWDFDDLWHEMKSIRAGDNSPLKKCEFSEARQKRIACRIGLL